MQKNGINLLTPAIKRLSFCIMIILILILIIILASVSVEATRDYSTNLWSEDKQLTQGDEFSYQYREMLYIEEQTTGMLSLTFENCNRSSPAMIQWMETDKLGGSQSGWNNTVPFPDHDSQSMQWFWARRARASHYDESLDRIQLIMRTYNQEFGFFEFNSDGKVIFSKTVRLEDFYLGNVSIAELGGYIDCVWDANGVAHMVFPTLERLDKDNLHLKRIMIYYSRVTWHPFSIQFEKMYEIQRLNDTMLLGPLPTPLIGVTSNYEVAVLFIKKNADEYFRTLGVRSNSGNWTFHDLGMVKWNYRGAYAYFSGLYIDDKDIMHIAWVSPGPYLRYVKATKDGVLGGGGKDLAILTDFIYIDGILVDMDITPDGDLLFTFNDNPYTASHLYLGPGKSQVHIVVLPDDDLQSGRAVDHLMVEIPTASEAQLIVDTDGNIYLFWFDQRTGIAEVYFRYLAQPGITFSFDPLIWAMASTIRPGETKVIPLEIRNVGTVEYDVAIYPDTNASYLWEVWLDRYQAHLEPHTGVPFNLTITCPKNASDGESIVIWVNATTSDRDLQVSIHLAVHVKWKRDLDVSCSPTHHLIDPGGWAYFNVVVHNLGEMRESLEVIVTGSGSQGWFFSPLNASMELTPDEIAIMELSVGSPPDARSDDAFTLILDFKWTDGNIAHPGIILRTVIRPSFFVTMELNESSVLMRPGEERHICATVANRGDLGGTAYVEVSVVTDPGDWLVLLTEETVLLKAGEREDVELVLTAPSDAVGGEIMVVKVRAYSVNPFSEVYREVIAQIMVIHSIEADSILRWELYPQEEEHKRLTIENHGNLIETVWLRTYGNQEGWRIWYEEDGVSMDAVRIAPSGRETVDVWISVPADEKAGRFINRLYLEIDGTTYASVLLEVVVEQIRDMDLFASVIGGKVYPGGLLETRITVTNQGNGDDLLDLGFQGLDIDDGWFVFDKEVEHVWLPLRGERSGSLMIIINESAPFGEHTIDVHLTSTGDPELKWTVPLTFEVVMPELTVSEVETLPSPAQMHGVTTIIVTLYNPGDLQVTNVTITFMDGPSEHLVAIRSGGTAQVVFAWVFEEEGSNDIHGRITYEPGSCEKDWEAMVDVHSNEVQEHFPVPSKYLFVVLLSLIMTIFITIAFYRHLFPES